MTQISVRAGRDYLHAEIGSLRHAGTARVHEGEMYMYVRTACSGESSAQAPVHREHGVFSPNECLSVQHVAHHAAWDTSPPRRPRR